MKLNINTYAYRKICNSVKDLYSGIEGEICFVVDIAQYMFFSSGSWHVYNLPLEPISNINNIRIGKIKNLLNK